MRPPDQWAAERGIPIDVVREIQRDAMLAISTKDCSDDPPPRSPVEFRLAIGAESRERLSQELEQLADRIRHSPNHYHPISANGCWGGAGTCGDYALDVREDITREAYETELQAWAERCREKRRAQEQGPQCGYQLGQPTGLPEISDLSFGGLHKGSEK